MPALQDTEDLFSIFHDGTIAAWSGNRAQLALTIDCRYLAGLIDPSFESFIVELSQIAVLSFETWPSPFELPVETFHEPFTIFAADLEILSAKTRENVVEIACNQHDKQLHYCGGILRIRCEQIRVYDQQQRELTIDQLDAICTRYWERFGNRE